MKRAKFLSVILITAVVLAACGSDELKGTKWAYYTKDNIKVGFSFNEDGTGTSSFGQFEVDIEYETSGNTLSIISSANDKKTDYTYEIEGDTLKLTDKEDNEEIVYTRE